MKLVNLNCEFDSRWRDTVYKLSEIPLQSQKTRYTGMVWDMTVNSMAGSYLDLPGHIKETDDGQRGDNQNLADYYRVPTTVIHLDRASRLGAVTGAELEAANGGSSKSRRFLMVNALWDTPVDDLPSRSVYLDDSAVQWIIDSGAKLLISDIFESTALEGVFLKLFRAGISTICEPRNMHLVPGPEALVTIMFPRVKTTQIPVSIVAEC